MMDPEFGKHIWTTPASDNPNSPKDYYWHPEHELLSKLPTALITMLHLRIPYAIAYEGNWITLSMLEKDYDFIFNGQR